ncbi:hypothetical protein HK096_008317, partial [Nowakowskiella sp. JEL0078]
MRLSENSLDFKEKFAINSLEENNFERRSAKRKDSHYNSKFNAQSFNFSNNEVSTEYNGIESNHSECCSENICLCGLRDDQNISSRLRLTAQRIKRRNQTQKSRLKTSKSFDDAESKSLSSTGGLAVVPYNAPSEEHLFLEQDLEANKIPELQDASITRHQPESTSRLSRSLPFESVLMNNLELNAMLYSKFDNQNAIPTSRPFDPTILNKNNASLSYPGFGIPIGRSRASSKPLFSSGILADVERDNIRSRDWAQVTAARERWSYDFEDNE